MIPLRQQEVAPYIGGLLQFIRFGKYELRCGIRNLSVKDNMLRIEFSWATRARDYPHPDSKWLYILEPTVYNIDLDYYIVPNWLKEGVEKDTITLFSVEVNEILICHLPNSSNNRIKDFNPLLIEHCYESLLLANLDSNLIPKVNFKFEDISSDVPSRFVRIDLEWQGTVWSFVRIQKKSDDKYSDIYDNFSAEVSEVLSLSKRNIGQFIIIGGGGYISRLEERILKVEKGNFILQKELVESREFTRSILREELNCKVY